MTDRDEVCRLKKLLAELVAEKGLTHRQIDNQLGYCSGVTSKLFRESRELRISRLMDILSVIGMEPKTFFKTAYPAQDDPLSKPAPLTPDELTDRIKAALREVLKERTDEEVK